jgi:hypothetical protein
MLLTRPDNQCCRPRRAWLLPVVLLLLALPLTAGCLTTLAVSAVAGSGAGSEHLDAAKQTAKEAADVARETACEIAQSAEVVLESWGSGEE